MAKAKRKISRRQPQLGRVVAFNSTGEYFDLQSIFDRLNEEFFDNALEDYTIIWGRRRTQPPKDYFVFGSIQEEDRLIKIHPRLDASWVPLWFLEYVIYHEMLHSVVPDEILPDGRRKVHTDEFYRREKEFPHYHRARRWENKNLNRFFC